ncbi:hypothetical protein MPSEU_000578700 [Mayamaea pseudoterrestris]|nr:hypothetical protein MPSEU_000578700 [Mayamaea pseudoterrestris]
MTSPGVNGLSPVADESEDITIAFKECASSLTSAEPFLCNKNLFSLHDAMAALQLTDRKMDCCEIPLTNYSETSLLPANGSEDERTIFPRPAPTGLADSFHKLPWDDLTTKDVAYIAIHTLIRFQAFLAGSSVGESSATCLYAHQPVLAEMRRELFPNSTNEYRYDDFPVERILDEHSLKSTANSIHKFMVYTLARALLQVTEDTRTIIVNADIYEEEDFSIHSYDLSFFKANDTQSLVDLLKAALQLADSHELDGDKEHGKIIHLVLNVYLAFVSTAQSLEDHATDLNRIQTLLQTTVERLNQLESLVKPFDTNEGHKDMQILALRTFDSFVNRPLIGNAPVRKPNFRSPSEASRRLRTIILDLDWALCNLMSQGNSLAKVQRTLDRVQQSSVNIYVRSLIVTNLFFGEKLLGQHDLKVLMVDYMQEWTLIPETYFDHEHCKLFLGRLAKPFYDVLKLKLLNRCRQRAFIEAVSIPDWLGLQADAHMVDMYYRRDSGMAYSNSNAVEAPHFSHFVLTIVLRLMDRHLSSGLEIGLFWGYQDVAFAFWYRDYLLSALLNNLLSMRRSKSQVLMQHEGKQLQQALKSPSGKVNGKKHKVKVKGATDNAMTATTTKDCTPAPGERVNDCEILFLTLKRDLCRGMKRFVALLQQNGILQPVHYEFTTPRRLFEERFELFRSVQQPPFLDYDDFLSGSDFSNISAPDLLRTTTECFQSCKRTCDQLLTDLSSMTQSLDPLPFDECELRWLQKVCVGNAIYLAKLKSIISSNCQNSTKVTFDFGGANQFCIVKLA